MSYAPVFGRIFAQALMVLRNQNTVPMAITNVSGEAQRQTGAKVEFPVAHGALIEDHTMETPVDGGSGQASNLTLDINRNRRWKWPISGQDLASMARPGSVAMAAIADGIGALCDDVTAYVLKEIVNAAYERVGVAGTTPFGSDDRTPATEARKILVKAKTPKDGRYLILDPDAYQNALDIDAIKYADRRGSTDPGWEGEIGRMVGLRVMEENQIPEITTGAGGVALNGAAAAGVEQLTVDGAGTVNVGDPLTIEDDNYVATTAKAAGGTTLGIAPALRQNVADNRPVKIVADHTASLALARGSAYFASKPMAQSVPGVEGTPGDVFSHFDSNSGLALEMQPFRVAGGWYLYTSIWYGVLIARQNQVVRVMG